MPIKANIETLITTDLASASSITAAEHRNVLKDDSNSILTELYNTSFVQDTHLSTNVFTLSGTNKNYTFNIQKQGGFVHMTGNLFYTGSGLLLGTAWATITNTEYEPNRYTPFLAYTVLTGEPIRMALFENGATWDIRTIDGTFQNEDITFNFTYSVGQ